MTIRDTTAQAKTLGEPQWAAIEEHLRVSWRSLHAAVQLPR
jgi:hypothetical protein